jgi:hypothetical protein
MRTPGFVAVLLAVLCAAAPMAVAGGRQEAADPDVVLEWVLQRREEGRWSPVEVTDTVTLAAEDEVRFGIRPVLRGTFVYLLVQDSGGAVDLLFPREPTDFTAPGYEGTVHFVPPVGEAFRLTDSPAVERFTLLASPARLARLEAAVAALRKAGADGLATARQRVLDEVAALRRAHSTLTVVAEKPVAIAGSTRDAASESLKAAAIHDEAAWTRVEAVGFWIRTFRVAH